MERKGGLSKGASGRTLYKSIAFLIAAESSPGHIFSQNSIPIVRSVTALLSPQLGGKVGKGLTEYAIVTHNEQQPTIIPASPSWWLLPDFLKPVRSWLIAGNARGRVYAAYQSA